MDARWQGCVTYEQCFVYFIVILLHYQLKRSSSKSTHGLVKTRYKTYFSEFAKL